MATDVDREVSTNEDSHEANQTRALARLPKGMAIMKLENDTMQSLAAAHPRNMEAIKEELGDMLRAFPQLAENAIYTKPVGREDDTCADCKAVVWRDKRTKKMATECFACKGHNIVEGQMKYAEGLSVRAAETLAEVYGYNRVRSDTEIIDADNVKVSSAFTDFQRGRIWDASWIVSKTYIDRKGREQRIQDDRFYNTVVKSEISKAVREVINRSVNAGLKAWFEDECRKITAKFLTDEVVGKIVAKFAKHNISLEMIEKLLGQARVNGWNEKHRKILLGVFNALETGETTVAEAFELDGAEPPDTSRVKPSDLKPTPKAETTDTDDDGYAGKVKSIEALIEAGRGNRSKLEMVLAELGSHDLDPPDAERLQAACQDAIKACGKSKQKELA